jgi:RimJ/RimL family protein N-acetyltransferase
MGGVESRVGCIRYQLAERSTVIELRPVEPADLDEFFEYQQDPDANHMAAFAAKNPSDRGVFNLHWQSLLDDETITVRTVTVDGEVVGSVLAYPNEGYPELSYWTAKSQWGKGVTTAAVEAFLKEFTERPIRARVVKDNLGSVKVLHKLGFRTVGEAQGFANARGAVVTEEILELA